MAQGHRRTTRTSSKATAAPTVDGKGEGIWALIENTLFGKVNKVDLAIQRIRSFAPPNGEPYYLGYSGGKDSDTILRLTQMAGVLYEAHYYLTTVDPPEVVQHVRERKNVNIDSPRMSMWRLIQRKKLPPTRLMRYCCDVLKEGHGQGRILILGVRRDESNARKQRHGLVSVFGTRKADGKKYFTDDHETVQMVHSCYEKQKHSVNPIYDWTDDDVWEFLKTENVVFCGLYREGHKRLGCIGCPMAGNDVRKEEFQRWPKYKLNYIKAFDRMITARIESGLQTEWRSGEEVFDMWSDYNKIDRLLPGQEEMELDEL